MKCRICGKKPVIFMPQHRLALCAQDFPKWFEKTVHRTVKEFRMFSEEDRVLVAVSGGKDSLALWKVLRGLGYSADGLYIDLGIGEYSSRSQERVLALADQLGAELITVNLREELAAIPELREYSSRETCSLCGMVKRYFFNKVARERGYDVVATGHNLDDEAGALLGNVLGWNLRYLGRKLPVLEEEEGFVRKVKPLVRLTEKETALYCILSGIDYIEEECPFSEGAPTISYKEILNSLEEKSPGTKMRFYFEYIRRVAPLFERGVHRELTTCRVCGEPSPAEVCGICRLRERVVNLKGTGRSSTG